MRRTPAQAGVQAVLAACLQCAAAAAGAQALQADARLLDLAGWQQAPLRPWRTANAMVARAVEPGEQRSPAHFIDVHRSRYLADPGYPCRRPALARWFGARPGPRAPSPAPCPSTLPFLVASTQAPATLLQLDPARVYAVDYLLAEGDGAPMSRWGHAMLRVVACAPGRTPGPDCRLDLGEHLVLSFRAFVDDAQVSGWRGLTGGYPSRLFVLPLAQVVSEYTQVELRGLRSIPLQLTRGETAQLLQRAALVHWSYDGRYAFVGNNCAVETARLLQVGLDRHGAPALMSITPRGLLRRLQRAGLAKGDAAGDRADAVRRGLYFEPADAHLQALYAPVRERLRLPWPSARAWLRQPAARRGAAIPHAGLREAAALRALEQLALQRTQARALDALKRRLPARQREAARAVLGLEARLTSPALLLPAGAYGIPQPGELGPLQAQVAPLLADWQAGRDALLRAGRAALPAPLQAEWAGSEANLAAIDLRLLELVNGKMADEGRR